MQVINEPNVKLKIFNQVDGLNYIPRWFGDEYEKMWRHHQGLPTAEDCANFPRYTNNIVLFVTDLHNEIIGLVLGYHVNFKDSVVHAGCLVDVDFQKMSYGRNAQVKWIETLFNRYGFRKVIVENVDEYLTAPYLEMGFTQAGRLKSNCIVGGQRVDEIVLECFAEDFKPIYKSYDVEA